MSKTNILLESGTNELEIVEFYLEEPTPSGGTYVGYYGVNVAKVLEIIRLPRVTEMPQTPHPCVLGTFNLRDKVVPLVDLGIWLGKDRSTVASDKVVVTEFNRVISAFRVSGVTRIHRLSWEQIEPPSIQVQYYSGNSVTGVVQLESRVVFILDMEKIVAELNPDLALKELDEEKFVEHQKALPDKDMTFKALIADDSTTIRRMIGTSLEKAGFEVTRTINGRIAWDTLLQWKEASIREERPITDYVHILVSDIEMPAMDGHSLTRKVKSDPVLSKLPVILFSSLITDSLRHKGEAVGADDQISKPEMLLLAERARALAWERLAEQI
jgi:two-component system, chemotaxis family, chemotaxis protein CheV